MAIRVNVGQDTLINKKIKAELTFLSLDNNGLPQRIGYNLLFFELDNITPATGSNNTQRRLVSSYEEVFTFNGLITSGSRLYTTSSIDGNGNAIPNVYDVATYFGGFAINKLPGVANGDPYSSSAAGILKEVINVRQANGELPV